MAKPDWEAIESAYRAGSLSIREIAAKHGVSDTAIRKRASANGWQRDLTDQVKKATRTKLVRSEVRRVGSQPAVRTDEDIIEQASSEAAGVVLGHRTDLADWRRITNKLRTFLDDVEITEDNHASIARTITAGVDAQIKLIKGERESYNIDSGDKNTSTDSIAELMDDLAKG
ncbi:hypothetical protein [Xenorhabdus lircayensis]|uniref:Phage-like protein n=1 Tax=Xenorhabdus lircayensis TaxID=2763499 RepID=A0ABS0U052_9GAMM|nr:hypothetical protein [Xenorhabdus lircayensis]MBI6547255.1 hypothetical protein [Xenorhabdus lircayensis]